MPISVVLVDGRKLLREGLSLLLARFEDIRVIGDAEDAQTATRLVSALKPDCVVLTISVASAATSHVIRQLLKSADTRVITNIMHGDPQWVPEVLRAGGSGCLTRDCASEELVSAIRTVAAGGIYVSPNLAGAVMRRYVAPETDSRTSLSRREREILTYIADGNSTKVIARTLHLSGKTIETYRRRIMDKLGKHTVAELTKHAVQEGLTSLEMSAKCGGSSD
jgi:NarL family two-component system response regulator LiaR